MLEVIRLKNFQAHESLTLKLSPTVTTITGKSDSGKSSVVRALWWLVFNRPLGVSFVRKGSESCKVKVLIDGRRLSRIRGEGNEYFLDRKIYKALGQGIPEPIQNLLNLGPENFQRQHDPHFWLSLSPGDLAQELNKIVSLDLIDRVTRSLSSQTRAYRSRIQVCEERLQQAKEKAQTLSWVEQADRELCTLEDRCTVIAGKTSRIDSAAVLIEEGRSTEERCWNVSESILDAGKVLSLRESLVAKQERYDLLYRLTQEARGTCQKIAAARASLERSEKELARVRTCPLCGASTSKLSS